jgi:hypothetical protein
MLVTVEDGRAVAVRGDPEHPWGAVRQSQQLRTAGLQSG